MQQPHQRPWYKKKRYVAIFGLGAIFALASASDTPAPTPAATYYAPTTQVAVPKIPVAQPTTQTAPSQQLSNDNYYTNVSGNQVHSPAYSDTVPVGASAQCRDGTYSFSQHRRGTCSHHGGVATWL